MPRGDNEFGVMKGFCSEFSEDSELGNVECKELDDSMVVEKGSGRIVRNSIRAGGGGFLAGGIGGLVAGSIGSEDRAIAAYNESQKGRRKIKKLPKAEKLNWGEGYETDVYGTPLYDKKTKGWKKAIPAAVGIGAGIGGGVGGYSIARDASKDEESLYRKVGQAHAEGKHIEVEDRGIPLGNNNYTKRTIPHPGRGKRATKKIVHDYAAEKRAKELDDSMVVEKGVGGKLAALAAVNTGVGAGVGAGTAALASDKKNRRKSAKRGALYGAIGSPLSPGASAIGGLIASRKVEQEAMKKKILKELDDSMIVEKAAFPGKPYNVLRTGLKNSAKKPLENFGRKNRANFDTILENEAKRRRNRDIAEGVVLGGLGGLGGYALYKRGEKKKSVVKELDDSMVVEKSWKSHAAVGAGAGFAGAAWGNYLGRKKEQRRQKVNNAVGNMLRRQLTRGDVDFRRGDLASFDPKNPRGFRIHRRGEKPVSYKEPDDNAIVGKGPGKYLYEKLKERFNGVPKEVDDRMSVEKSIAPNLASRRERINRKVVKKAAFTRAAGKAVKSMAQRRKEAQLLRQRAEQKAGASASAKYTKLRQQGMYKGITGEDINRCFENE